MQAASLIFCGFCDYPNVQAYQKQEIYAHYSKIQRRNADFRFLISSSVHACFLIVHSFYLPLSLLFVPSLSLF